MAPLKPAAFALLLLGAAGAGLAAGPPVPSPAPAAAPEPATTAVAAPSPPAAVPASEVPRAAIGAETRVRTLRSLANRTRETEEISASATNVLRSIDALKEWMRTRDPRQQTSRALRSLAQEWRLDHDQLVGWMQTTGTRLDALAAAREEVRTLDETWTATETTLVESAAPEALLEHVRSLRGQIAEVGERLRAEIDAALLLQSRISAANLDAEEALDAITAALREERSNLFKIESPPIWKAFSGPPERVPLRSQFVESFRESVRALRQYAERAGRRLELQIALFVVLAVVFFRLQRRSSAWPREDKGIAAFTRLVERPILGALLVAVLSGVALHPRAPVAFYEISSIVLVFPVVALMGGIVQPRVRGALFLLAAIFVTERIWESTPAGTPLERLVLFPMTLLSGVVLWWTIRPPAVINEVVASRWWRAVTVVGRLALGGLAIAAIANILGNVSLARLLTAVVVRSAYWAVVLYAADLLIRGLATLALRAPAARVVRSIEHHGERILRRVFVAIDAAATVGFFLAVLNATGQWSLAWASFGQFLTEPWGVGGFQFSLASALVFVGAVGASLLVSRFVCIALEEDVYSRVDLPRGLPGTLTMLVRYGLVSLGFLFAAAVAGIPLDRLAFVLGAFSVGIGFGLQTVVNNFVSGLILMFERPIQVGDTVELGGLVGRVRQIGVRASRIETGDGAEVIVPNGTLISGQLINWTLSTRDRRIEIQVSAVHGTEPDRLLVALRDAVKDQPDVLPHPAPSALVRKIDGGAVDASLYFWTGRSDEWSRVRSDMTVRVHRVLGEAGIVLSRPAGTTVSAS